MVGSMRVDGLRTAVTVNTGRADSNGGMRLRIQAEPEVQKVSIESDGDLRFDGAAAKYAGDFRLAARREQAEGASPPPAEGPGFRVKGKFALDNERLAFDEFLFETGPLDNPYSAEGKGFVDFGQEPRFALSLDGAQVRFDEAIGAGRYGQRPDIGRAARGACRKRCSTCQSPSIPGTVEVNLPAVVAGDTTVRDVRLSAEPATRRLDGEVARRDAARTHHARGRRHAADRRRSRLFRLAAACDRPALGLRRLGVAGCRRRDQAAARRRFPRQGRPDAGAAGLRDLELGLGNATFRGEAERRQPRDAKPATVLKLAGGALDVDGLAAFASLFVSDVGVNRFADGDLDLEVKAGPVSAAGLTAQSVDTAFRLREGLLEIDRLSIGDLAGATVSATGTIKDFPANPAGNIDASLVAVDLAPLIAAAAERYKDNVLVRGLQARAAAYRGLFEDARLDVVATAAANGDGTTGVAVSANGKAGGTILSATLSGNGRPEQAADADMSLALTGRNDDATELLALYGLPVLPLGLTGPGETGLSVKGKLSERSRHVVQPDGRRFLGGVHRHDQARRWRHGRKGQGAAQCVRTSSPG